MTEEDRASGRATHEQSRAVSAVPVGSPDASQDWEGIARNQYLSAIEWAGRHQYAMHILSDLDAAVFLAAEYSPDMKIGEFFAASGAVKRSREFLFSQQYLEYPAQGMEARQGGDEGSVHDSPVHAPIPASTQEGEAK